VNVKQRGQAGKLICFLCQSEEEKHLLAEDIEKVQRQNEDEEANFGLELNSDAPANIQVDKAIENMRKAAE